jgi:AraC-like DNA-binding protein
MSVEAGQCTVNVVLPTLESQLIAQPKHAHSGVSYRADTITSRYQAVERVIMVMRERLHETLSMQTMAEIAILSPYHFNRIFRQITGIPPSQFLYALRLAEAKRLLLTSQRSVTDVCFEVGYNSLGTFTTRFTQLVGLSPRQLRALVVCNSASDLESLCDRIADQYRSILPGLGISGHIYAPSGFTGVIFMGLFPTPIPQSEPFGCALLTAPGAYCIAPVSDGDYYLFATGLTLSEEPLAFLLYDSALRASFGPLQVRDGKVGVHTNVTLRPARLIDPPLLIALPRLLTERLSVTGK